MVTVDQDPQTSSTPGRKAGDDLALLVAEGLGDGDLEQCLSLADTVLQELEVFSPISPGARIILLREVLTATVSEQRLQALEQHKEGTYRSAARRPSFQVAAAGELLGLTDDKMFEVLRDYRCRQYGESWEGLRAKEDNKGAAAEAQLRAALWIGGTSARNLAADRHGPKLMDALESAVKVYARKHRADLRGLIADEVTPSSEPALPSRTTQPADRPSAEEATGRPYRAARGSYVRAVVGVLAVAGVIAGISVLADGDPSAKPGPEPSTAAPPATNPGESAGPRRIDDIAACSSLPRDSQWARELRSRMQVVVDGRCYPDPTLQVGAQTGPGRTFPAAAHLDTGQVLESICLKSGQSTRDMVGSSSSVWVRFKLDEKRQAFVSAIWVQGEEGADPC